MKIQIKKVLAFFLATCFVLSVTAASVCAVPDPTWNPTQKQNYMKGFIKGMPDGYNAGYIEGWMAGFIDCQNGAGAGTTGPTGGSMSPASKSAYDIGVADGYNYNYPNGFSDGYKDGFVLCDNEGSPQFQMAKATMTMYKATLAKSGGITALKRGKIVAFKKKPTAVGKSFGVRNKKITSFTQVMKVMKVKTVAKVALKK